MPDPIQSKKNKIDYSVITYAEIKILPVLIVFL